MKKYTTFSKLIELNEFNLEAYSYGFELLALNKQLNPEALTPIDIISASSNDNIKEPYEWLAELIGHLIVPNLELLGQDIISNSTEFFNFIDKLDRTSQDLVKVSILRGLNDTLYAKLDSFDSVLPTMLDDYFGENNLRVTTIASTFFDINLELLIDLENHIPFIAADYLDLAYDLLDMSYINLDASISYHNSSKYQHSLSIITYTSSDSCNYSIFDDYVHDSFEKPDYVDSFKEAYKQLLKNRGL